MQTLWQDLRYGARMLMKQKSVTAIALLSLALGIGANTALFSVVDAVLLKTLPVKEPGAVSAVCLGRRAFLQNEGYGAAHRGSRGAGTEGLSLFRYEVFARMRQAQA